MNTRNKLLTPLMLVTLFLSIPATIASAQEALSWEKLADLDYVESDDGFWEIEFGASVKALAGKSIKMYGFMMPLETSMKQSHFILSMLPLDGCQFCAPGTQAQFVEVKVKGEGIEYTLEPIEVAGTLELLPDAPMGVYFLINEAKQVD